MVGKVKEIDSTEMPIISNIILNNFDLERERDNTHGRGNCPGMSMSKYDD